MRKIFLLFILAIMAIPSAVGNVSFEIAYGINSPALQQKIERQASLLLNAINNAAQSGRDINFSGINISDNAAQALSMTWNQVHFHTEDNEYVEAGLSLRTKTGRLRGYQVRNIGVTLIPVTEELLPYERQELCIDFSPTGQIVDLNFTMDNTQYARLLAEGEKLNDIDQRMQILGWCEKFRQAYIDKNLPFMDAVFSEDALIITGKVIAGREKTGIEVTAQGKAQYLAGLKRVFARSENIDVRFNDYKVQRHPTKPDFYYVTLVQHWNTKQYSDEGIVVLVWDFTDEDYPKILVRTWQPIGTKPFNINDIPLY